MALGAVTDTVEPGGGDPSVLGFWGAVIGAGAVGAPMVGLATDGRMRRVSQVPAARLLTVPLVSAAYWVSLVVDSAAALLAAPSFVAGRIAAHGGLVLRRS